MVTSDGMVASALCDSFAYRPDRPLPPACVLVASESSETFQRTKAELSVHWGQMYGSILKLAFYRARKAALGLRHPPSAPAPSRPRPRAVVRAARQQVGTPGSDSL